MSLDTATEKESDLTGRIMALEQKARGLNARVSAIERSITAGQKLPNAAGALFWTSAARPMGAAFADEFVPAQDHLDPGIFENSASVGPEDHTNRDSLPMLTQANLDKKHIMLSFDITGLIAGAMLVLVSLILYTGNIEMLKNPVVSFIFGAVLIGSVSLQIMRHQSRK